MSFTNNIICDRCEAETINDYAEENRGWLSMKTKNPCTEIYHFCPSCVKDFKKFMERKCK